MRERLIALLTRAVRSIRNRIDTRRACILIAQLKTLLGPERITLVDVGAAGDIEPRWKKISPLLNYIGFEPDARSREELLHRPNSCSSYRILPFALWDENGSIDFHLCRKPQTSSYYVPNFAFLKRFPESERFEVVGEVSIGAARLDSPDIKRVDFIKLDIQGGELTVLRGATNLLSECLGIEAEVEFVPLYEQQPLFGDLCDFLSKRDFEFMDFLRLSRWERAAYQGVGQCVFADALFLKSPETLMKESASDIARMTRYIGICVLYNSFDLVDRVKTVLDQHHGAGRTVQNLYSAIRPIQQNNLRVRKFTNGMRRLVRFFGEEYGLHLLQ